MGGGAHILVRDGRPRWPCIARGYLLKWHGEGQLPYATLVRRLPHADSVVRGCENWLAEHYTVADAIRQVIGQSGIPGRTLKRRCKAATGSTLIDYLQNLRVEAAKRLLESGSSPVDDICVTVGYEDASTPSVLNEYRFCCARGSDNLADPGESSIITVSVGVCGSGRAGQREMQELQPGVR
jgi:AraC-like DNA-binding protein